MNYSIQFLGHACLLIDFGGKKLLVDPYIRPNPLTKGIIEAGDIICDYILITHAHGDHIADVETIVTRTGATIISNFEIANYYEKKGFQVHKMNHGGKSEFNFGILKYVNAIHTSVFPDGTSGGNPGGFVIYNDEKSLYIAGDTALTQDMKLIPLTCPQLDIAILPVGDTFTMGYEDACIAADFVECGRVLGYHYDTFPPIKIDSEAAQTYFSEKGKELLLPHIGEMMRL